jgi:hypothetical protein
MGFVVAEEHHYASPPYTFRNYESRPATVPHPTIDNTGRVQLLKTYRNTINPAHIQYSYPPPTQKPGYNPLIRPQNHYASAPYPGKNKESYNVHNLNNVNYIYPPSTQKIGSNPFNKSQNHQYAGTYPTEYTATDKMTYDQRGVIYIYPPLTKKLGSNPFSIPAHQYTDSNSASSQQQISDSDQEKYRYLYYHQPKPRYIESHNGFMSYTDTHLMYP